MLPAQLHDGVQDEEVAGLPEFHVVVHFSLDELANVGDLDDDELVALPNLVAPG